MSTVNIDDPVFRLRAALKGFHGARLRYDEQTVKDAALPEDLFISLGEALWWACVVDEGYMKLEEGDYTEARKGDANGRVLPGLRYARNRKGHQLAMLVAERTGLTPPATPPFTPGLLFRWRPVADIPPADKAYQESGKESYISWLAGKPADHTLVQIAEWFATAQNRPGGLVGTTLNSM